MNELGGTEAGVRSRPFHFLLGSWAASSVGDGVRSAALPLFTAVSTRDPLAVSAVAVATVLPWLLVALPAGALVDRWRPRTTLICVHAVRCAALLSLAALIHAGNAGIAVLVISGFLLSAAETFSDSASQTLLVSLAGTADLERANGRIVSIETTGVEIAGPLAAAAVFAWDPAMCFVVVALALGASALLVAAVPEPVRETPQRRDDALAGEVLAGLRFLVRSTALRTVVGVVGLTALLTSAVNAVAPLYAIESLGLPAASVPTLIVCTAIGSLMAAPLATSLSGRIGNGSVMIAALLALALGIALLGLAGPAYVAWGSYFVMGLGAGAWNVLSAANRQRLTPPAMMGRVTSAHRVLAWGLMPLGAGIAGPMAEASSLRAVIIGAAVLTLGVALVAASPLRSLGGQPSAGSDHAEAG